MSEQELEPEENILWVIDEPHNCDCPDEGIPRYMGTFADLMTLMLCFFVLLLSMAEIDALKYKMVVRSMEDGFGVDRIVPPDEIPMGTSIIKQEFSPSEPRVTPLNSVRQSSSKTDANDLEIKKVAAYKLAKLDEQQKLLKKLLKSEISDELLSIEMTENRVVIRISERASFPSGTAHLKKTFIPVLEKIRTALSKMDTKFIVAGHTDDIPITSVRYRSNWELSAARAISVAHVLLDSGALSPDRFRIEGYGATLGLVENNSEKNRAMNRRVEIGLIN